MAEAFLETTVWDGPYPNHTYLLEGDRAIAYIKVGTKEPFYFSKPIQLDKRGRKFQKLDKNPFGKQETDPTLIEVKGSKGDTYYVDPVAATCTCSGFKFRGTCKHLKSLEK